MNQAKCYVFCVGYEQIFSLQNSQKQDSMYGRDFFLTQTRDFVVCLVTGDLVHGKLSGDNAHTI